MASRFEQKISLQNVTTKPTLKTNQAAKPQWKKPSKSEDKKPEVKGPVHTYFFSSDEDEPDPEI